MGVIQRQATKGSIMNAIGILLGFIATIFVYPLFTDGKGFLDYLISFMGLLVPFANVGLSGVLVKYYPYYKSSEKSYESFKGYILFRFFIRYLIFVVFLYFTIDLVGEFLVKWNIDTRGEFQKYYWAILILLGIELSNIYLEKIAMIHRRIVVPEMIRRTSQKIFFPIIILIALYLKLTYNHIAWMLIGYYILVLISLYVYNKQLGFLNLRLQTAFPEGEITKREVNDYSFFGSLNGISQVITNKMDLILVNSILGFTEGGIYSIIGFISNTISLPYRPILGITYPFLSESVKAENWKEVDSLYKKTSLISFTFGSAVLMFLWFDIDSMLALTKYSESLLVGKNILLALGLAKIFDMLTSVNGTIIQMSKDYRWNLLFILILSIGNIGLSYYFIHIYGGVGAAYATFIIVFIYNILKFLFLYFRYKLSPFTWQTLAITGLSIVTVAVLFFLPTWFQGQRLVEFIVRSAMVGLVILIFYLLPIYRLNLSPDVNNVIDQTWSKLKP